MASGCGQAPQEEQQSVTSAPIISESNAGLDVLARGPYSVTTREYNLGAGIDPLVIIAGAQVTTDVRGILFLPQGAGHFGTQHFPLVVFLHGNHGSCRVVNPNGQLPDDNHNELALLGHCEDGRVEVPSYRGYDYLADHLASHGYAVVSINANLGFAGHEGTTADPLFTMARGRLVLKHLAQLYQASSSTEADLRFGIDLRGQLDFSHVGLMGHSRGGEGVRAAMHLHRTRDPMSYAPALSRMNIEGVFEFAPVDANAVDPVTLAPLPLSAEGTNWSVVLGSCDRDVGDYQGVGPFSRRRGDALAGQVLFSSVTVIPGANHNYFNTEWKLVDGPVQPNTCPTGDTYLWNPNWDPTTIRRVSGSPEQQQLAVATLSSFFRGFVGNYPNRAAYQKVLDPQYRPPAQVSSLADPLRESLWHDLSEMAHQLDSSNGTVLATPYSEVLNYPTLAFQGRQVTDIHWDFASANSYYDFHLWEGGRTLNGAWIVSPSLARYQDSGDDPLENVPLDIGVQLLYADGGVSSAVRLPTYVSLTNRVNEQSCEALGAVPSGTGTCLFHNVAASSCQDDGGVFHQIGTNSNSGDCEQPLVGKRFMIFREVPIEIRDFTPGDPSAFSRPVRGVRFVFDGTQTGRLYVDPSFALRLPFKGDVNADGRVDINDALRTAQVSGGKSVVPFSTRAADVNCDGVVNINDALLISRLSAGSIESLPCAH
jgi:hypothetical protein